ncbi:PepSY-associated TM helix domain-containing protein [uncultured Sphingomonas sp.]|uniref:PepSY-associated TM helix domain-containing protein n=1 Tax=uncultured Sphingomonas sp. TaxID=158754 RepID=UPI0025D0CAAE|nr:PepSY-associated TM helix domain-containing protein [uncultured Sphingomonas sp.]
MAWLHTWTGLVLGWLLFAMFTTGTTAYFQDEITRWMQPEQTERVSPARAAEGAVRWLTQNAPGAASWYITLPNARGVGTTVYWQPGEKPAAAPADKQANGKAKGRSHRAETQATLDGQGNTVETRDTRGGFFLYRFHFDLHYMPVMWARYLVGVAAMSMLVAILSGIVTHKKIFADFFMLRFGRGQRSWLDAHNVTAVTALPFHLMITYTGLVTLATMYMPWSVAANYASPMSYYQEMRGDLPPVAPSGRVAALVPIGPILAEASRRWDGADAGVVIVSNPGDATANITVTRAWGAGMGTRGPSLTFSGVSGRMLSASPAQGRATATESVMVGLHAGRFANLALRWLYFLAGVGGTIMVASGLVLWTVKRRAKLPDPARPHVGFRLVEKLNVATIAGLMVGLACYFHANRLLPLHLADRAEWEINSLFIAWGACLVWSIVRPARRAWVEVLGVGAVLFAAIPLVNALTTAHNPLASLLEGDWLFPTFDVVMLVTAWVLALAALKVQRRRAPAGRRAPPKELAAA